MKYNYISNKACEGQHIKAMEFLRTDGICKSPAEARHVQFVVRRMTIVSHCHDPLVGGSDPKKRASVGYSVQEYMKNIMLQGSNYSNK